MQQRDEQQLAFETGSMIGGPWLCSLGGQANASNPHLRTVTFGVYSGAEVTVITTDTTNDYPRERGPKKAMEDYTGKRGNDTRDRYLEFNGPLGNTFAKIRGRPTTLTMAWGSWQRAYLSADQARSFKSRCTRNLCIALA